MRLADAVGVGEHQVAGVEEEVAFLVDGVGQEADDGAAAVERVNSAPRRTTGGLWPALT